MMAIKMSEKAYQDYLSKVNPVTPAPAPIPARTRTPKMPAKRVRTTSKINWLGILLVFMRNFMRVR